MNEIETILEQARLFVVQHAPTDFLREAVPAALVTLIFPVVAPAGMLARICVAESTTYVEAGVPLKAT